MDSKKLAQQVTKIINDTPIADIHTHLYSEAFGDLLLYGIDELITYHYLVAELFRYKPELEYETYWNMSKQQQADLIWDTIFVNNSPISEAARGVVTVLNKLGIDAADKDLTKIRTALQQYSTSQYIDKVFETANVKYAIMTNDPFDETEVPVWDTTGNSDTRFKPALRVDGLLNDFPLCAKKMAHQGFKITSKNLDKAGITATKDFLSSWIAITAQG